MCGCSFGSAPPLRGGFPPLLSPRARAPTQSPNLGCSGDATIDALDYHHISAVSVGVSGDMLITSRNLNTIWCVDAYGSGEVKWTLSSIEAKSDFKFGRDLDKFYTPHNTLELGDGKLLLIDDGSSRPGCFSSNSLRGCFSRAAMYTLDQDAGTVSLDWQFEDPYRPDGGTSDASAPASSSDGKDDDEGDVDPTSGAARTRRRAAAREDDDGASWRAKGRGASNRTDGGASSTWRAKHHATDVSSSGDDDGGGAADDLGDDGSGVGWVGAAGEGTGKASEEMGVTDDDASRYYLENVMTRDSYNFDGGSAYRLEGGRILVAFTSPYDSRLWNQKYSMRAYEVDKDGDSVVYITVPHDSDALESQGAYRMIPMKTVYGEATSPPFDVDDDDSA